MSEELLQRGYLDKPERIGDWLFYNLGSTNLNALQQHKIIPDIDYKKLGKKKPDALIIDGKRVIAVIEYKKPSEFQTEKQKAKAIKQEIEVAQKLGSKLLIVTDTKDTIWINALNGDFVIDEKDNLLKKNLIKMTQKLQKLYQSFGFYFKGELKNQTSSAYKSYTTCQANMAGYLVSQRATPENCLYTFVELFIFKYLSDLDVLKGINNFYNVLKMYDTNNEEEVLEFYANTVRKRLKNYFLVMKQIKPQSSTEQFSLAKTKKPSGVIVVCSRKFWNVSPIMES